MNHSSFFFSRRNFYLILKSACFVLDTGHVEVVKFLLEACKVNPFPKDRWNNTPMDEALHFGHHDVFKILQEYQVQYTPQGDSDNGKENQTVHKNLDGLL